MEKERALKKTNKRVLGSLGEDAAVEYLIKNGVKIIARNFRAGRMGEVDIIAREKDYICFLEVKTRKNMAFGAPSEAVGIRKRQNITRLAAVYISRHKLFDANIRFDVIEVIGDSSTGNFSVKSINHIKNAF